MSKQVLEGYKEKRKILKEISKRNEEKKIEQEENFQRNYAVLEKIVYSKSLSQKSHRI